MVLGSVEQGPRRHRVRDANGVYPGLDHEREVPVNHFEIVVLVSSRVGLERAVRHAFDVQLLVTDEEELAVNPWSSTCLGDVRERVGGD